MYYAGLGAPGQARNIQANQARKPNMNFNKNGISSGYMYKPE